MSYLLKKEHFNVRKQQEVYNNYRSYIECNYKKPIFHQLPFSKISDNCFVDHMKRCISKDQNICQLYSLNKCKGPPRIT